MYRSRPQFEYLDNGGLPIAFAHQGAGDVVGMEHRNSMSAIEAAVKQGYKYGEIDVMVSRNGFVFAAHAAANAKELKDATGTSNILRSELNELDYADALRKYGNDGYGYLPLLDKILRTFPDTRFNIDVKSGWGALHVARVIREAKAVDRVLVTSFDHRITKLVAGELGGQDRVCTSAGIVGGLAMKAGGAIAEVYLHTTQAACFQWPLEQEIPGTRGKGTVHVNERMIAQAADHGLPTHIWTLNTESEINRALDMGAQGTFSDEAALQKEIYQERHIWLRSTAA